MITKSQKTEVRRYLESKKLPIDVIMEVEDHFTSQIESFQLQNHDTFYTAFYKTKLLWVKDFELVRKSWIAFGKVPRIVKKIQNETTKNLLKKAIYAASLIIIFSFAIVRLFTEDVYFMISMVITALISFATFGLIGFFVFSRIKKQRTRAEKYFYNQILNIFLLYIFLALIGGFAKLPINSYKIIYSFINENGVYDFPTFALCTFQILFTLTVTIYLFLIMNDRAKSISKIKNYQLAQ